MPNWCNNNVTFTHEDPAMIRRVVDGYNANRLFREFFPTPTELENPPADANPDDLIEKFGAYDWYSWNVSNWGTKWDVSSVDEVTADGNSVSVYFDSAWSPPIQFYANMEELGFAIEAYFYEPGMSFCGSYINGDDQNYDITGDSAWVRENIPKELDEMFSISASMEEWAEERDQ